MSCVRAVEMWRRADRAGLTTDARRADPLSKPFSVPCGKCPPCKADRAADWATRIIHEIKMHRQSCFVTLTYDRDHLPPGGSVNKDDPQKFLKRLRFHLADKLNLTIRHYLCAEYGEKNGRGHYHVMLFGWAPTDQVPLGRSKTGEPYFSSAVLTKVWGLGRVSVQPANQHTADYIARYVTKKLGGGEGDDALYSRYDVDVVTGEVGARHLLVREFATMSRRPAIGMMWAAKYKSDWFPDGAITMRGGFKRRVPKRYHDLLTPDESAVLQAQARARREEMELRHTTERAIDEVLIRDGKAVFGARRRVQYRNFYTERRVHNRAFALQRKQALHARDTGV